MSNTSVLNNDETKSALPAEKTDKLLNVLTASKYNPKIQSDKIFSPGISILESLEKTIFSFNLTSTDRYTVRNTVNNDVAVHLDSQYSRVNHVSSLRTTLYRHQQYVVKAMLDLEYGRFYTCKSPYRGNPCIKIAYNVGVLSEPVGSGKTIDILAVICLSRIPRAVPDIMELKTPEINARVGYIRCKFKKFLKPTIIFVGSSVMKQWEFAIKTFTNLKAFSVNSVIELKVLLDMISNKTVNNYDIVLVKNGKITVPIKLPDGISLEIKNRVGQPYIYNIIANLRGYCWARVVVDDFDTIKLPHNAGIVRGIFTWYISSTRKKMEFRGSNHEHYQLASQLLVHHDYGCSKIMYNHLLFNHLNVRNNIEFLKATTKIPNPKYHIAVFKNTNNRYISLLNSMQDDEINRITEMLNADALSTAAEAAGIKSGSVANIFEKILGNKFKQYRFSSDLLEFIEYQEGKEEMRLPMSENPDPNDKYYSKKRLLDFEEIEYKYPGVTKLLKDTDEEYKEVKKTTGIAIQRVKDNIKHGKCPICRGNLDDEEEVVIVKCCSTVFCSRCGIEAQSIYNVSIVNGVQNKRLAEGQCSNCRTPVTIKDLIYIGDNINLENIVEEKFEEEKEKELTDKEKENLKKEVAANRTKYTAIIDIINNEDVPEDKRVDMYIPNMMKGAEYLPEAKYRKVLIFANFDETLKEVVKELENADIKYWRLQGGINEISDTTDAFTNCKETCAMVVNSTRHCSGLNLQTATDLIFTHRMIDQAVESQVAGRGHRLGRTSPLNIWYLAYDNEYEELARTHSVRELSADELEHEQKMEKGIESSTIAAVQDNTNDCYLDRKQSKKEKDTKTMSKSHESDDEDIKNKKTIVIPDPDSDSDY